MPAFQLINIRLVLACLVAVSVALPIAIISLAKVLLVLASLVLLLAHQNQKAPADDRAMLTPVATLLTLALFALSLLWTTATPDDGLTAWVKHSKLITIPLLLLLIQSRREALCALAAFGAGQLFLLVSTWLLVMGVPVPWRLSTELSYAVFSSYLDQSIMTAVFAAMLWHLRTYVPGPWRTVTLSLVALAVGGVFFAFTGRTGYIVGVALISLAIMWWLPARHRWSIVLVPLLLTLLLASTSSFVRGRMASLANEVKAFSQTGENTSSSGVRLYIWYRSLQAMQTNPVLGAGVGSWNLEYERAESHHASAMPLSWRGNPHQEYLLWGVELGAVGILLLLGWMLCIHKDAVSTPEPTRRALQSILAALALACLFNSSLYDDLIGDFLCVALGLVLALGKHEPHPSRATPSTSP